MARGSSINRGSGRSSSSIKTAAGAAGVAAAVSGPVMYQTTKKIIPLAIRSAHGTSLVRGAQVGGVAASVAIGVATSVTARRTFNRFVKASAARKGGGGSKSGHPLRDSHGRYNGWSN